MKRKLIGMAVLAAMMLGCMTGCGEKEVTSDNVEDVINFMSDEELESAIIDGAEKLESKDEASEEETIEAPTEVVYEPSQEIIDADFSSLLIQLNNDVFQQGGYMTVAELVEQYGDRYDIDYQSDKYIRYNSNYCEGKPIKMKPKYGDDSNVVNVYIANLRSDVDKITYDEASVVWFSDEKSLTFDDVPMWAPGGFSAKTRNNVAIPAESPINEKYTYSEFADYLMSAGFIQNDDFLSLEPMTFSKSDDYFMYRINVVGEPNELGLCPKFYYDVYFNFDVSEKLKHVEVQYVEFVTE